MKKLKALLVDDEPRASEGLAELLGLYCTDVEVTGTATSVNDAMSKVMKDVPDIVFLDIHMPGGNGFDLVDVIRSNNCSVVFVTGYADYAVQAFRVDAIDYLLKPVSYKELRVAVARAMQRREKKNTTAQDTSYKLRISAASGIQFVDSQEVIGIEADGRYSIVHLKNREKRLVTRNIGEFEEELDAQGFFRVHKSWLINCAHVLRLVNVDGGTLELSSGQRVLLSRRKKAEFMRRMNS